MCDSQDAISLDEVKESLLRDHQLLVLCAGLSGSVEEAQLRLSNSSTAAAIGGGGAAGMGDADIAPGTTALAQALQVISGGIETAVRIGRGLSLEEIDSQGLSVADKFYSEVCASLI